MNNIDFDTLEIWTKKLLQRAEKAENKGNYRLGREYRSLAIKLYRDYKEADDYSPKYIRR